VIVSFIENTDFARGLCNKRDGMDFLRTDGGDLLI
jgi:hypothetical protein